MKQAAKDYRALLVALGSVLYSAHGVAAEFGDIRWNGFLSAGGAISDSPTEYLERITEDGDFETAFGVSAAAALTSQWRVAGQLFAHQGSEQVRLDWAYATYEPSDNLLFKFGKPKYPNSLVSEFFDVGITYPWVRPPAEFYSDMPLGAQTTFEAYEGASAVVHTRSGEVDYALEPFLGDMDIDDGAMKKMWGIKASAKSDIFEVYAGSTNGELDIEPGAARAAMTGEGVRVWTLGGNLDYHNIVVYTEYGQSKIDNNPLQDSKAGYATLGYRFGKVLPYATYGLFEQDSGSEQTSTTLGLRYDVTASAAVKVEWQNIDPTQRTTAIGGEQPAGLFEDMPAEGDVNVFSAVLNLVF